MMYSEKVMDHFMNPRNVGEIEDASGVGEVGNAKCGDIMKIYIKVDENDVITDVKFKTFGCGAAIATSSRATEMVSRGASAVQSASGRGGTGSSRRLGGAVRAAVRAASASRRRALTALAERDSPSSTRVTTVSQR